MKRSLSIPLFALAGLCMCLGIVLLTDKLGIAPRFPAFAGEDDFALRMQYSLLTIFPAFFLIGGWVGSVFSTSKRVAGSMLIGIVAGTVIAFLGAHLLASILSDTSREHANRGVLAFFLSWMVFAGFGAWVLGFVCRKTSRT